MYTNKIKGTINTLFNVDLVLLKNKGGSMYIRKYVDADLLVVSVKQMLNVLKLTTEKVNSVLVYFVIKDKAQKSFFEEVAKKLNIYNNLKFVINLRDIRNEGKPNIIVLFNTELFKNAETFINHNLPPKTYFVFNINSQGVGINEGTYSLITQPEGLNKMLFFILLISKIIKNNKDANNS